MFIDCNYYITKSYYIYEKKTINSNTNKTHMTQVIACRRCIKEKT